MRMFCSSLALNSATPFCTCSKHAYLGISLEVMQPAKPVEQVVQENLLVPLYGTEKAKVVVQYVTEFLPYRSNFDGDVTASFYEAQGRKWLLLNCPLVLSTEPQTKLTIGVAFPPLFPDKWPYCVINDIGARKLVHEHPFVAANGVIRVQSLPLLQGSHDVPPLIQLFVSIQCALSDVAPFAASAAGAAVRSSLAVASQPAPVSPKATLVGAATGALDGTVTSPSAASASPVVSPQRARLLRAAAEVLHRHLLKKQDDFIDVREQCMKQLMYLNASRDTLQAMESNLAEKKRKLVEVEGPTQAAYNHALQWKEMHEQTPVDPRNVIVATDRSNEAALQLQAEIHAFDDAYDVLERSLKKGQLTSDEYVRDVSDIARMQFLAKFQLERITSGMSRDSSLAQLKARFPTLGSQVVEDVYVNAECNLELALTHLRAMSS